MVELNIAAVCIYTQLFDILNQKPVQIDRIERANIYSPSLSPTFSSLQYFQFPKMLACVVRNMLFCFVSIQRKSSQYFVSVLCVFLCLFDYIFICIAKVLLWHYSFNPFSFVSLPDLASYDPLEAHYFTSENGEWKKSEIFNNSFHLRLNEFSYHTFRMNYSISVGSTDGRKWMEEEKEEGFAPS